MSLEERKKRLVEWLLTIESEEIIDQVEKSKIKIEADLNQVLGYSASGKKFTKTDLLERIEQTEQQILKGNFFTTDQIKAQFGLE